MQSITSKCKVPLFFVNSNFTLKKNQTIDFLYKLLSSSVRCILLWFDWSFTLPTASKFFLQWNCSSFSQCLFHYWTFHVVCIQQLCESESQNEQQSPRTVWTPSNKSKFKQVSITSFYFLLPSKKEFNTMTYIKWSSN